MIDHNNDSDNKNDTTKPTKPNNELFSVPLYAPTADDDDDDDDDGDRSFLSSIGDGFGADAGSGNNHDNGKGRANGNSSNNSSNNKSNNNKHGGKRKKYSEGRASSFGSSSESAQEAGSSARNSRRGENSRFAAALNKEAKCLRCSKGLVFLVLLLAASSSAFAVYWISSEEEFKTYETRFEDIVTTILAVSDLNAKGVANVYGTVSQQITSYTSSPLFTSTHNGESWPFVHLPGFEAQTQQMRNFTRTTLVGLTTFVRPSRLREYNAWTVKQNPIWIAESLEYVGQPDYNLITSPFVYIPDPNGLFGIAPYIPKDENDTMLVVSQISPIIESGPLVNINIGVEALSAVLSEAVSDTQRLTISGIIGGSTDDVDYTPSSYLVAPVFRNNDRSNPPELIATLTGNLQWEGFFVDLIPKGIDGIYLVVQNNCTRDHTFLIEGPEVTYIGQGDLHETGFEVISRTSPFTALNTETGCPFTLALYPTEDFYNTYHTRRPILNTLSVLVTFLATALVFVLYDWLVERRQNHVMKTASRSNAILSSLFPENVRERLMNMDEEANQDNNGGGRAAHSSNDAGRNAEGGNPGGLLVQGNGLGSASNHLSKHGKTKPIADLFPQASVLFADIVGFTAWSSMREPTQVFELLETLYNSFDVIARRLGVFKVETIGDCYVAATGLPEANPLHALVMVRFARTCLSKTKQVMETLAVSLGPSTRNLVMRVGIHSGPVTAGVLRGEKSRFQLFGDTVNTASRIESNGKPNMIHISQETADELIVAGKASWLVSREDKIVAKGKGELQTYWIKSSSSSSSASQHTDKSSAVGDDIRGGTTHSASEPSFGGDGSSVDLTMGDDENTLDGSYDGNSDKRSITSGENMTASLHHESSKINTETEFEIQWNVDVIQNMLKKILAMRDPDDPDSHNRTVEHKKISIDTMENGRTVLDEVKEVITLPSEVAHTFQDYTLIELSPLVQAEVLDYVRTISQMYRTNSFHSFSHASHVVQSTVKLMSRVVGSDAIDYKDMTYKKKNDETLHQFTYGITSDPVTQFACLMAALVHDVDHAGVPNSQLVKEDNPLAQHYRFQSIAEQNSLDLAWELLMEPRYDNFRACIYNTQDELDRFRQLLVNVVMATDIMDKELGALRKKRWEKAFEKHEVKSDDSSSQAFSTDDNLEDANRMATIVIEHLIQASDVAHTMQHWHVFIKWNERLFDEMYEAYLGGRADTDPSESWYKGEIGFFDFYIIPLAKKLKECGVFGVSSDEYLNYAQANRKEWETRGKDLVAKYMEKYNRNQ